MSQLLQDQYEDSSCEAEVVHNSNGSHKLEKQLKVSEDKIVAVLSHHDKMHQLIENHFWKVELEKRQKGIEEYYSHDSLHIIKEGMGEMK